MAPSSLVGDFFKVANGIVTASSVRDWSNVESVCIVAPWVKAGTVSDHLQLVQT